MGPLACGVTKRQQRPLILKEGYNVRGFWEMQREIRADAFSGQREEGAGVY